MLRSAPVGFDRNPWWGLKGELVPLEGLYPFVGFDRNPRVGLKVIHAHQESRDAYVGFDRNPWWGLKEGLKGVAGMPPTAVWGRKWQDPRVLDLK